MALGISILVDAPQWEAADELLKSLDVPHDAAPLARGRKDGRARKGGMLGTVVLITWAVAVLTLIVAKRDDASTNVITAGILLLFAAMLLTVWHLWRNRPKPGSYDQLDEP